MCSFAESFLDERTDLSHAGFFRLLGNTTSLPRCFWGLHFILLAGVRGYMKLNDWCHSVVSFSRAIRRAPGVAPGRHETTFLVATALDSIRLSKAYETHT